MVKIKRKPDDEPKRRTPAKPDEAPATDFAIGSLYGPGSGRRIPIRHGNAVVWVTDEDPGAGWRP